MYLAQFVLAGPSGAVCVLTRLAASGDGMPRRYGRKKSFGGHGKQAGRVTALAFSPDGLRIASVCADRCNIELWDAVSMLSILQIDRKSASPARYIYCLAFSPCGLYMASGNREGTLAIYHLGIDRQRMGKNKDYKCPRLVLSPPVLKPM